MFTHNSWCERGNAGAKALLSAFQYRGDIEPYQIVRKDYDKDYYLFHLSFLEKLQVYFVTGMYDFMNKREMKIISALATQLDNPAALTTKQKAILKDLEEQILPTEELVKKAQRNTIYVKDLHNVNSCDNARCDD